MVATRHILIGSLALFISLISPNMADVDTVKSACSKSCQTTYDQCKIADVLHYPNRSDACAFLKGSVNGVSEYRCLVKNGFCTDNEFIKLKNEACGENEAQRTVSTATSELYQALSATSTACQIKSLLCIRASNVAIVQKQQGRYCDLVNIETDLSSSQKCLTESGGCSSDEFDRIKTAACSSSAVTETPFAKALMDTSSKCKKAIDICTHSTQLAVISIYNEQYCSAMSLQVEGRTMGSCLVYYLCSQSEFDNMRTAACGVVPGYNSLTKDCQKSVDLCKIQALSIYPELTDTCAFLNSTFDNVNAFKCLVTSGSCTESEFNRTKNDACDRNTAKLNVPSAKTVIYVTVVAALFNVLMFGV